MFIFPRKQIKHSLIDNAPNGSVQYVSDKGWITEYIFCEFHKHFVKNFRCTKERKVLLILDGHTTHTKNLEAILYACENGIILLSLYILSNTLYALSNDAINNNVEFVVDNIYEIENISSRVLASTMEVGANEIIYCDDLASI